MEDFCYTFKNSYTSISISFLLLSFYFFFLFFRVLLNPVVSPLAGVSLNSECRGRNGQANLNVISPFYFYVRKAFRLSEILVKNKLLVTQFFIQIALTMLRNKTLCNKIF
jgi:hypothetical protein